MNKIICDICGTSYPETASQCPICGNAKSDNAGNIQESASQNTGYAYVKGGRFSHSNVRKRNNGKKDLPRTVVNSKPATEHSEPTKEEKPEEVVAVVPQVKQTAQPEANQEVRENKHEQSSPETVAEKKTVAETAVPVNPRRRERKKKKDERAGNIALTIIVVLLMLAILAVCMHIGYLGMKNRLKPTEPTVPTFTDPTTSSTATEPLSIPCTGLVFRTYVSTLNEVVPTLLLTIEKTPVNTTDMVLFESSDTYIATVDASGVVTAVAKGQVTITARCGDQVATFDITCNLSNEPAYPTEPPVTTEPTTPTQPTTPIKPNADLKLKSKDITLRNYGETADLYYNDGVLTRQDITWTSSNEDVVTVTNGYVKAVGKGTATVYAEYGGKRVSCIVRCETVFVSDYEIRTEYGSNVATDVSIKVGASVRFYLVNKTTGERVDVTELVIESTHPDFFTVDEDGRVTGVRSNYGYNPQYLQIIYEGITYKCQIRVNN